MEERKKETLLWSKKRKPRTNAMARPWFSALAKPHDSLTKQHKASRKSEINNFCKHYAMYFRQVDWRGGKEEKYFSRVRAAAMVGIFICPADRFFCSPMAETFDYFPSQPTMHILENRCKNTFCLEASNIWQIGKKYIVYKILPDLIQFSRRISKITILFVFFLLQIRICVCV